MTTQTNITDAEVLDILLQDINGTNVYSNDKALYGYVPASKFLLVPEDFSTALDDAMSDANSPDITLDKFGSENSVNDMLGNVPTGNTYRTNKLYRFISNRLLITKTAFMNYIALKVAGLDAPNACVAANLRARWLTLGCITAADMVAARAYNEVRIIKDDDADFAELMEAKDLTELVEADKDAWAEYINESRNADYGNAWITMNAEAIWAVSEYVFRVRGHHFKADFEHIIIRTLTANFEGNYNWPEKIKLESVFHTAIHPFGVRALPIMTAHFAVLGKLGNAIILRFSGAPNGMAVVTTARAALLAMASEAWYSAFSENYKTQIKEVVEITRLILSNKFKCHISARIYGEAKMTEFVVGSKTFSYSEAIATAGSIATVAQGYINALESAKKQNVIGDFSLSNAKSLNKAAGANPLLTLKVTTLITKTVELVQEAKTLLDSTAQVFPKIAAAEEVN